MGENRIADYSRCTDIFIARNVVPYGTVVCNNEFLSDLYLHNYLVHT